MRAIFRERLFKKHYDKLILSRKDRVPKAAVNSISSVTILAIAKHHPTDELKKSLAYFQSMDMACHIYLLIEKGEEVEIDKDVHIIHQEECEWYGVPSQEILIAWLAHKTDVLIVSNPNDNLLMKYLCAASNSKLKTSLTYQGKKMNDPSIDFCVDVPQNSVLPLYEQCTTIYTYLTRIGVRPPVIG